MTQAWSRFWLAMAIIAASLVFAAAVFSDRPIDWAGWAQFFGTMGAVGVAWAFGRQEALDRRAEAANLARLREHEIEAQRAAAEAHAEKWIEAVDHCALRVREAADLLDWFIEKGTEIELEAAMREVELAEGMVALMLQFEPPATAHALDIVYAKIYVAEAGAALRAIRAAHLANDAAVSEARLCHRKLIDTSQWLANMAHEKRLMVVGGQ